MNELARVLVVEDDPRLGQLLAATLREYGYHAQVETRGDRAEARILAERPDLVLLDLGLPGVDGLTICRRVRPQFQGAIVMLTGRRSDVDQITGLEVGADDYVLKPVDARLLIARVRSVLRRVGGGPAAPIGDEPATLEVGALRLDRTRMGARVGDADVELTAAEFRLLWTLARHVGELVHRGDLSAAALGSVGHSSERGLDVHVSRIRRKLAAVGWDAATIRSIRGVGYLLAPP